LICRSSAPQEIGVAGPSRRWSTPSGSEAHARRTRSENLHAQQQARRLPGFGALSDDHLDSVGAAEMVQVEHVARRGPAGRSASWIPRARPRASPLRPVARHRAGPGRRRGREAALGHSPTGAPKLIEGDVDRNLELDRLFPRAPGPSPSTVLGVAFSRGSPRAAAGSWSPAAGRDHRRSAAGAGKVEKAANLVAPELRLGVNVGDRPAGVHRDEAPVAYERAHPRARAIGLGAIGKRHQIPRRPGGCGRFRSSAIAVRPLDSKCQSACAEGRFRFHACP